MGSFAALHIRADDTDRRVVPIGHWLASHGFGAVQRMDSAPASLQTFGSRADTVGLGRLNAAWSILVFNGIRVGGRALDASVILPLAVRVASRVVFFAAQTTSDVYQLVVFDGGTCVRSVALSDGECLTNEGQRLPGERAEAFSMVTANEDGVDDPPAPLRDAEVICSAMGFELWPNAPLPGAVHVWRRRGLFSRLIGG